MSPDDARCRRHTHMACLVQTYSATMAWCVAITYRHRAGMCENHIYPAWLREWRQDARLCVLYLDAKGLLYIWAWKVCGEAPSDLIPPAACAVLFVARPPSV